LIDVLAGWQRGAAVEDPDIVQSQKPTLEYAAAGMVFLIYPQVEVQHQLVEYPLQEFQVALAAICLRSI